jgi:putative transposase
MDMLALFQCLRPHVTMTTLRQFHRVAVALLVMTGRVTMLGLSRWAGPGGSYRTVQRFFSTVLPWATLVWVCLRQHLYRPGEVYLLAGDAVVVTQAGHHTHGLERFFASLYGKPGPGLAFFTLSVVSTQERRSFPLHVEQVVRSDAEKAASKAKAAAKPQKPSSDQRRRGRPQGSKNTHTAAVTLTPELGRITSMITALRQRMAASISLTYVVLDGHFGNHHAWHMARPCDVHLVAKLRSDSALSLPFTGLYAGRGPQRMYGSQRDYRSIPEQYLKATTGEGHLQTRIYQAQLLHKEFSQALHVVIIVKMNLQTQAGAHVILFSSDLDLPYDRVRDYYGLRFHIEFHFREAKQYWGLEDFMNVTNTAVTNAANLALFMVNVSHRLLRDLRQSDLASGSLDLKAQCRGDKYVTETITMLPEKLAPVLLTQIFTKVACLGRIHVVQPFFSPG